MKMRFMTGVPGLFSPIDLEQIGPETELMLPGYPFVVEVGQSCQPQPIKFEDVSVASRENRDGYIIFNLDMPDTPLNLASAAAMAKGETSNGASISFGWKGAAIEGRVGG